MLWQQANTGFILGCPYLENNIKVLLRSYYTKTRPILSPPLQLESTPSWAAWGHSGPVTHMWKGWHGEVPCRDMETQHLENSIPHLPRDLTQPQLRAAFQESGWKGSYRKFPHHRVNLWPCVLSKSYTTCVMRYPGGSCTCDHCRASAEPRVYLQNPESSRQSRGETTACLGIQTALELEALPRACNSKMLNSCSYNYCRDTEIEIKYNLAA